LNLFLKEKRDFGFVKIGGAAKRELDKKKG